MPLFVAGLQFFCVCSRVLEMHEYAGFQIGRSTVSYLIFARNGKSTPCVKINFLSGWDGRRKAGGRALVQFTWKQMRCKLRSRLY
jgi:hypothetical protein